MSRAWRARRATWVELPARSSPPGEGETGRLQEALEWLDGLYRSLCAILYNYVPTSGHPGGSISAGRILAALHFASVLQDLGDPDRDDADMLVCAAGHKALGLYAMLALRDEVARCARPGLLPASPDLRIRLEDLLGFRRSPAARTELQRRLGVRMLDGHPTPATPFVPVATGASGVGLGAGVGLAWAALDRFGEQAPQVHLLEGEGGLTPGRVSEALAAAGTASLHNLVLHVDWNQASIDSDRVCGEEGRPGDYVAWSPAELLFLNDWNVVEVADGMAIDAVLRAQRLALSSSNGQPTAVVYRTVKGWRYGIEGRRSHGAGHALCSDGFYLAVQELLQACADGGGSGAVPHLAGEGAQAGDGEGDGATAGDGRADAAAAAAGDGDGARQARRWLAGGAGGLASCPTGSSRCLSSSTAGAELRERCFWQALQLMRRAVACRAGSAEVLAGALEQGRQALERRRRRPRDGAPALEAAYRLAEQSGQRTPPELICSPGTATTSREQLGRALNLLSRASNGAFPVAAADLLGSTSASLVAGGFDQGFWHSRRHPGSRTLALGGICEDAMAAILSGISAFGHHVGVGSSYGAFIAPLGHVAARLHAIGGLARQERCGGRLRPLLLVCAHAGLKTGEDGPTHADPQALQLLQGNFPPGAAVTLTPWEPNEIWPLLTAALEVRPALIAPFVTRPAEQVPARETLGLAPAAAARSGVYLLHGPPDGRADGVVVLQGSGVALAYVREVLPRLQREGLALWTYYVSSAELFDLLPVEQRRRIYPERHARRALGITGFTLETMQRWLLSVEGRAASLHPFVHGRYPGSGPGEQVLIEACLDPDSQHRAIRRHLDSQVRSRRAKQDSGALGD